MKHSKKSLALAMAIILSLGVCSNAWAAIEIRDPFKAVPTLGPGETPPPTPGTDSIVIGLQTNATGARSIAIGQTTAVTDSWGVGIGYKVDVKGEGASAFGYGTTANKAESNAFGCDAEADGIGSNAIGTWSSAEANYSNAFGLGAYAAHENSTAIGSGAVASGLNSLAIGNSTVTSQAGGSGMAYDFNSQPVASGNYAIAMGTNTKASAENSVAFGKDAKASGVSSIAMGTGAEAKAKNSVAIGTDSVADAENTVSVGAKDAERRIVNVAAAKNPTDALTFENFRYDTNNIIYSMEFETDKGTETYTFGSEKETSERIAADKDLQDQINKLGGNLASDVERLDSDVKSVGAMAAAMAGLHPRFTGDGKGELAAAIGSYDGKKATAIGAFYAPDERFMFSLGGAFAAGGKKMANLGVNIALDPKPHVNKKFYDEEIAQLKAENQAQAEQIQLLMQRLSALEAKK